MLRKGILLGLMGVACILCNARAGSSVGHAELPLSSHLHPQSLLQSLVQPLDSEADVPRIHIQTKHADGDSLYFQYPKAKRHKSRIIALALCVPLGWSAAHRYYMGARKAVIAPGYLVLNVVMWFTDIVVLSVDGMDRFLYTDRFFAGIHL